jgi:ABC-type antimicrobial peptide transport system permease subunit
MSLPLKYSARSLVERRGTVLMTVASIAFVVLVYLGVLSLAGGLRSALATSGDPAQIVVLRDGALSETSSFFSLERGRELMTLPGIARDADGLLLAAGEVLILNNLPREDGSMSNVTFRGVAPISFRLRPELAIVDGRTFRPGSAELIVGRRLSERFPDLRLGSELEVGRLTFRVVGIYEAGGSSFDSEVWGAADDLASAFRRAGYFSSALVRAPSEAEASALIQRIESDQRLNLQALTESDYYARQTAATTRQFVFLANALAVIMAIGACFAAANTMYAAVSARTREIATLRVLGFRRRNITAAFVLEAALLGLVAGLLGVLLSLPLNTISTGTTNFLTFSEITFSLRTTPRALISGVLLAVLTGVIGGLPPAWSAARRRIQEAMRAV